MRDIVRGISWSLFLLLLFVSSFHQLGFSDLAAAAAANVSAVEEMVPVAAGKAEMMAVMMKMNESGRRILRGRFQVCSLCTCCGGAGRSYCMASPCCYAINCNIPNRPFGYCSFTPKACNCFGCHI